MINKSTFADIIAKVFFYGYHIIQTNAQGNRCRIVDPTSQGNHPRGYCYRYGVVSIRTPVQLSLLEKRSRAATENKGGYGDCDIYDYLYNP